MRGNKKKIFVKFLLTSLIFCGVPAANGFFTLDTLLQHITLFPRTATRMMGSERGNGNKLPEIEDKEKIELKEPYDFIVIGSGAAGGVIASRLSEVPHWKILLLEAGNPPNVFTSVPLYAPLLQITGYNWNYTMEKQDGACLAMVDQLCAWPRGKALGGTSEINYMIYTRGNPRDFDRWEAQGNPGWSYPDVLKYYLKSEDCNLNPDICSSKFHAKGGNLNVEYPFRSRFTDAFLESGRALGYNVVDYNSENFMGFSQIQATIKKGRRRGVAETFLKRAASRQNLKIVVSARVTKILMDPDTKKATGVKFTKRGKTYVAKASKEVILSAGTFNSPQLLMLSGIGPRSHLDTIGIPMIHDLPVGRTMYDHISFPGVIFKINQTIISKTAFLEPNQIVDWIFNGTGIYSNLGGIEGIAYINTASTPASILSPEYPDIELLLNGFGSLEADLGIIVAKGLRIRRQLYNKFFRPLETSATWSIFPMLLHPRSKGYVELRSKNPYDAPRLFGNLFSDPEGSDLDTLVAGIRFIIALGNTEPFKKLGSTLHEIPVPGCEHYLFGSDEYWKCALRTLTITLHHQIGTCKMGPKSDDEAVVDNRLRVHGVQSLRVADSSIIPVTISAHTNAPAIMIGEKTADIIKEDWGEL